MKKYILFLTAFYLCICASFGQLTKSLGQTWVLEDKLLKVVVDQTGRITHLENKADKWGNVIDHPADGLFKMVCKRGENWEDVVFPEKQTYRITKEGNTINISVDKVVTRDATSAISLVMTIQLANGKLTFGATIDNRQEGSMVTDFMYPQIGVVKQLADGKPDLLWPSQAGEWHTNIGDMLSNMPDTRQSPATKSITYPGYASMQWMALVDNQQCLYLAGHDAEFYSSTLRVTGSKQNRGSITLGLDRFAFVKTNEQWKSPESVLMLYTGSWHKGADEYRSWAATWRTEKPKTKWVQDMMGYFLVINKQQYGDEMWNYNQLPQLHKLAQNHGFDVLGLFGWYDAGHDNMYPDIHVAATLGGASELRDNIKKVQNAGGHVTLYFQGHLMDVNAPFYKQFGQKLESKSIWGVPYYEKYNKYHNSDFLMSFTSKTFSTVCPSCTQWHDLMTQKAEEVSKLGPDGMLYDQIGGMSPNPCFDESHAHLKGKPSLSYSNGRLQLLGKIQAKTRQIGPDFGFFTEHITDVYSQFVDCLHGIGTAPDAAGNRLKLEASNVPASIHYPELFRYCFPNTIITIRNPFPYLTPQAANYALTFGLRPEMELRYLDDCQYVLEDRTPQWKTYAANVTALKKKHWDILGYGTFVDEKPIRNGNRHLITKAFQKDNELAVVVWNDNTAAEKVLLTVDGYSLTEVSSVEGSRTKLPELLQSQQVLVVRYKKNG